MTTSDELTRLSAALDEKEAEIAAFKARLRAGWANDARWLELESIEQEADQAAVRLWRAERRARLSGSEGGA